MHGDRTRRGVAQRLRLGEALNNWREVRAGIGEKEIDPPLRQKPHENV